MTECTTNLSRSTYSSISLKSLLLIKHMFLLLLAHLPAINRLYKFIVGNTLFCQKELHSFTPIYRRLKIYNEYFHKKQIVNTILQLNRSINHHLYANIQIKVFHFKITHIKICIILLTSIIIFLNHSLLITT